MNEVEYTLGAQCGITFAGIKAASLFSVKSREEKSLKNYARHFSGKGIYFVKLKDGGDRILLYVYNKSKLEGILFDGDNRSFLRQEGYRYSSCEEAIAQLKCKIQGENFPHEVGLFLDYPLDDVKGFIADPKGGECMCGYWKVYSQAEAKAATFKRYDCCSRCILNKLREGKPLCEIFK